MSPPRIAEQDEQDAGDDAGRDRLDAQPVGDLHVAGVAGLREALLGSIGERARGDPRHRAGQARGERPDRAIEERRLELQLLEVLGRHLAELREPGLERVRLARAGDAEGDQEDGHGRGAGDEDGFHG